VIRVEIGDAHLVVAELAGKIKLAKERGILSAAQRLVQVIKTQIIPSQERPPVDQGAYLAGWDAEPTALGADVFNDAPHAPIVEYGARAPNIKIGRQMILALSEWVVRKGLIGRGRGSIHERAQNDEAQSMAWAIANSMKNRGIFNSSGQEGLRILEQARARLPKLLEEEIAAELQDLLSK